MNTTSSAQLGQYLRLRHGANEPRQTRALSVSGSAMLSARKCVWNLLFRDTKPRSHQIFMPRSFLLCCKTCVSRQVVTSSRSLFAPYPYDAPAASSVLLCVAAAIRDSEDHRSASFVVCRVPFKLSPGSFYSSCTSDPAQILMIALLHGMVSVLTRGSPIVATEVVPARGKKEAKKS